MEPLGIMGAVGTIVGWLQKISQYAEVEAEMARKTYEALRKKQPWVVAIPYRYRTTEGVKTLYVSELVGSNVEWISIVTAGGAGLMWMKFDGPINLEADPDGGQRPLEGDYNYVASVGTKVSQITPGSGGIAQLSIFAKANHDGVLYMASQKNALPE